MILRSISGRNALRRSISIKRKTPLLNNKSRRVSVRWFRVRDKTKRLPVILTKTSERGGVGDEIYVKRGFARNYLFPNNMAVYSTDESRKVYAAKLTEVDLIERRKKKAFQRAKGRLQSLKLKVKRQESKDGSLHAPVDSSTIATQLFRQFQITVDKEQIITEPLNAYGTYIIKILLDKEKNEYGDLNVEVYRR